MQGRNRFESAFDVTDSIRLGWGAIWTAVPATKQVSFFFADTRSAAWQGRTTLEVTDSLHITAGAIAAQGPLRTLAGVPAVIASGSLMGEMEFHGPSVWLAGSVSLNAIAQWTIKAGASLEIQGSTELTDGQGGVSGMTIEPGATVIKTGGRGSRFQRSLTVEGRLYFQAGGFEFEDNLTLAPGAELKGLGNVDLFDADTVTIQGTVSPGLPTGIMRILGNWFPSPGSVLEIDLAGPTDSLEYDRLVVTHHVELGGALMIDTLDGFVPAPGSSFAVLTYGSRGGAFESVSVPSVPGLVFDTVWAEAGTIDTLFVTVSALPLQTPTAYTSLQSWQRTPGVPQKEGTEARDDGVLPSQRAGRRKNRYGVRNGTGQRRHTSQI